MSETVKILDRNGVLQLCTALKTRNDSLYADREEITEMNNTIANKLNKLDDIAAAIAAGGSGGSSIDVDKLKKDIIDEVMEKLKPEGHVYPEAGFFPKEMAVTLYPLFYSRSNNLSEDDVYAIEHMDVSRFKSFQNIFSGCYNVNQSFDLTNWDVSNATDLSYFAASHTPEYSPSSFGNINFAFNKLDLSGWDTHNVTNLTGMFMGSSDDYRSTLKKLDVSGWDVRNVQTMAWMFSRCNINELDLSTWDTSYISNFTGMFNSAGTRYNSHTLSKLIWGGAINATPVNEGNYYYSLALNNTQISAENANIFFASLAPKTTSSEVIIRMPSASQGADISIATNKGYTITGITAPEE